MQGFSKRLPVYLCLLSCGVLGFVYALEYVLHVKPCQWCLYQRIPYLLLLVVNLIWLRWPIPKMVQAGFNTFVLAINTALPFVHVLIEKGYVNIKCNIGKLTGGATYAKLSMLVSHKDCVKVNWTFLGWSMAQWHLLFAGGILILYVWGYIYEQRSNSTHHPR